MNTKPNILYIIQVKDTDYFRVGITSEDNIKKRFKILQHGNHRVLIQKYIGKFSEDSVRIYEKLIHVNLKKHQTEVRDWFYVTEESIDTLIEVLKRWEDNLNL